MLNNLLQYRADEYSAVVNNCVYLNHAASSPMASRTIEILQKAMLESSLNPERFFLNYILKHTAELRKKLSTILGAPEDDIAIMRNTGHGLSVAADGLDLSDDENVIVVSCDYPSVVYPWYAQKWRGIETRVVTVPKDSIISADSIARHIDSKTRVICISWIQFATGYRINIEEFSELAHKHGCIFIVDVIQGLGALPINVIGSGIDICATGSHKWLLGPHGVGALYIKPELLNRMHLVNVGATSVVDIIKFDPLDFNPKPNAQRYEEGSPNGLGIIGLNSSLGIILEAGIEHISQRIFDLTEYAIDRITSKGYRLTSPRENEHRAGIVLFDHPDYASDALLTRLREANIVASVRNGCVRLSPHFYNTEIEIDAAIDALPS